MLAKKRPDTIYLAVPTRSIAATTAGIIYSLASSGSDTIVLVGFGEGQEPKDCLMKPHDTMLEFSPILKRPVAGEPLDPG